MERGLMKAILYDVLLIVFGMLLIVLRNFYATIGLPRAKSDAEKAEQAKTRMYQFKRWNAFIVGACFVLYGAYLLYLNLMKMGQ